MSIDRKNFYRIIEQIPEGRVATYGQIAALAGHPRHARQVGYALAALPQNSDIPWFRVVNARGEISPRGSSGCDDYQRLLLENEGIAFGLNGRIVMRQFQWQPKPVDGL